MDDEAPPVLPKGGRLPPWDGPWLAKESKGAAARIYAGRTGLELDRAITGLIAVRQLCASFVAHLPEPLSQCHLDEMGQNRGVVNEAHKSKSRAMRSCSLNQRGEA